MNGKGKLLWGYYKAGDPPVWLPIQVDANGKVIVDMSAINLNDLADVSVAAPDDGDIFYYDEATGLWKPKKLDGSNLSQAFGASATRLRNLIATPLDGYMIAIGNCSGGAFSGLIDDNAGAHGGQGLDATHVPYDNDTYEDMFKNMQAYGAAASRGRIILHNTTRSNSRKVVSVDRTNDVITTESSTDDWADNDVIDCESQTVESGDGTMEFVDIDISNMVGPGVDAIMMFVVFQNNVAAASIFNNVYFHPYVAYDVGKRQWAVCQLASEQSSNTFLVDVIDQKITFAVHSSGTDDFVVLLSIKGTVEFADT